MKQPKKINPMTKRRKSKIAEFSSVEEFKKEYFPRSSSQSKVETETDPETHGVARAAKVLDEIRSQLNRSDLNT